MSRTRRGSGSRRRLGRAPAGDLPSTLGGLLRTTLQQVGAVKDAVERQARSSRDRLDEVVLQRKRRDTLARVGELVYEMAVQDRLDELYDSPELARLLADVEDIEDQLTGADSADGVDAHAEEPDVVSSASWTPPRPASRAHRDVRVWRPVVDEDDGDGGDSDDREQAAEPAAEPPPESVPWQSARPGRPRPRRRRARGPQHRGPGAEHGGIAFVTDAVGDPDEDLAEYMHDDDVGTSDE